MLNPKAKDPIKKAPNINKLAKIKIQVAKIIDSNL